jgi:hypothetical protein
MTLIDKAVAVSRNQQQDDFLEETLDFIRLVQRQTSKFESLTGKEIKNA